MFIFVVNNYLGQIHLTMVNKKSLVFHFCMLLRAQPKPAGLQTYTMLMDSKVGVIAIICNVKTSSTGWESEGPEVSRF